MLVRNRYKRLKMRLVHYKNVGIIGDEVALAGANQLAIYGLKSEEIKKINAKHK